MSDASLLLLTQARQREQDGDWTGAEPFYRRLAEAQPGNAQAASGLGRVLCRLDRPGEAVAWLRQASRSAPGRLESHVELAEALQALGRSDEAMRSMLVAVSLQATVLNPAGETAHFNLARAFNDVGDDRSAAAAYRRAVTLQPAMAEAHNNLGVTSYRGRRLADALAAHRRAVRVAPAEAAYHTNLAHALLAAGDLAAGLAEWEWRAPSPPRNFTQPLWDGRPFAGKVLLAHAEQGYGDAIQFARYLPAVAALGGRLVVECRRPLLGLLSRMPGVAEAVAWGDPLPQFDLQIPIPSLPHRMGTTAGRIPAPAAYLAPEPGRAGLWRIRLAGRGGFKLGVVWAGNPQGDMRRALPPAALAPLASLAGITLVCLQRSDGAPLPAALAEHPAIVDCGSMIEDFDDLAGAIGAVDLLLSVDTAAAHLAGALGRPAWVLLHSAPDWRWWAEEDRSPWYPSLRLYRQAHADNWTEVIERVAADLRQAVVAAEARMTD